MLSLSLLTLSGRINKPNFLLKSQPLPLCDDWQTAPPTHAHRVKTARHSFNCHKATRWLSIRVTYDWHCSRGLVRVTPEEQRVGGWHRGKQTAVQCSWAACACLMAPSCQSGACVSFTIIKHKSVHIVFHWRNLTVISNSLPFESLLAVSLEALFLTYFTPACRTK